MKIVLIGSPGSGKGTQAVVLGNYFDVPTISLGDILREEVKKDSALGNEVKSYMDKGLLVPDELVCRVIEGVVDSNGFVLDGFPRNVAQAQKLEEIVQKKGQKIDLFIYLDVDEKTIVDRLSQRLVCKNCGTLYHLKNMPPQREGVCDRCNEALSQRKDDTPEVIKKRWDVFLQENQQLLDFYQEKGTLLKVDGRGNKDDVFARIKQSLS